MCVCSLPSCLSSLEITSGLTRGLRNYDPRSSKLSKSVVDCT